MKSIGSKSLNASQASNAAHPTQPILWQRLKILSLVVIIGITQNACLSTNTYKSRIARILDKSEPAQQRAQEGDYQGAIDIYQAVIDEKPGTSEARKAQLAIGELHIDKMDQPEVGVADVPRPDRLHA